MPFRSRPGIGSSLACSAPMCETHRVVLLPQRLGIEIDPYVTPVLNSTPSAFICSSRRSIDPFLHFKIRYPVTQQAADAIGLFIDRDSMAGACQLLGGRQPAGPEPITATFFRCSRQAASVRPILR